VTHAKERKKKPEDEASVDDARALDPRAWDWIVRAQEDRCREMGRIRELVTRQLARRAEPTRQDLADALKESPGAPIPQPLIDYAAELIRDNLPRKPGRKSPPRSTWTNLMIRGYYVSQLERARRNHARQKDRDERARLRPVKQLAAERTAQAFGLSLRTVERIVLPRTLLRSPK